MQVLRLHCVDGYLLEFYCVASRMNKIFNIILLDAVKIFGLFSFLEMTFLFCFPEKEQSINRAGIVQEDIQPAGIPDSCVCLDCLKDIFEVRPEYLYGFK